MTCFSVAVRTPICDMNSVLSSKSDCPTVFVSFGAGLATSPKLA